MKLAGVMRLLELEGYACDVEPAGIEFTIKTTEEDVPTLLAVINENGDEFAVRRLI